jgi:hypothetical protein
MARSRGNHSGLHSKMPSIGSCECRIVLYWSIFVTCWDILTVFHVNNHIVLVRFSDNSLFAKFFFANRGWDLIEVSLDIIALLKNELTEISYWRFSFTVA